MSVIRFTGGLGNQLFQICFGKTLSDSISTPTVYDAYEYRFRSTKAPRKLEIPRSLGFDIKSNSNFLVSHFPQNFLNFTERKINKDGVKGKYSKLNCIREGVNIYDSQVTFETNAYYIGNFISTRYWNGKTQETLSWISNLMDVHMNLKNNISNGSIGIHVRRGDYLNNSKVRNLHGYCTDQYYLDALERIVQMHPGIRNVFLSSDSPVRTSDLYNEIRKRGFTVELEETLSPMAALIALAKTNFFIGSNSTFSWWAAALNEKQISIFPKDWFISGSYGFDFNEYFPFRTIGIDNALTNVELD